MKEKKLIANKILQTFNNRGNRDYVNEYVKSQIMFLENKFKQQLSNKQTLIFNQLLKLYKKENKNTCIELIEFILEM